MSPRVDGPALVPSRGGSHRTCPFLPERTDRSPTLLHDVPRGTSQPIPTPPRLPRPPAVSPGRCRPAPGAARLRPGQWPVPGPNRAVRSEKIGLPDPPPRPAVRARGASPGPARIVRSTPEDTGPDGLAGRVTEGRSAFGLGRLGSGRWPGQVRTGPGTDGLMLATTGGYPDKDPDLTGQSGP
jgi:hypothetical protein